MGILFLGLTLYSGELVSLFAPPVYYDSARYLGFIGAAVVLTGCNQILAIGNCMVKKTYYNNIGTLAGTTCNLLGLYLTISIFGIAAAACWLALGALSSNILNFWTSQRNHRIPYNYGRFGFFVLFLACVALWNLTSTVSTLISPSHILIKAMVLVFGILALGYSLLDRLDRQKGLKMLLVRFGY
jgi:O-antigen/teichoic acid export membrane protein